jgi:hypothetical protein
MIPIVLAFSVLPPGSKSNVTRMRRTPGVAMHRVAVPHFGESGTYPHPERFPRSLSEKEVPMKRFILALAALVTLTAGAVTTANAVEFGVGPNGVYVSPDPNGVYVGPDRYRHYHEYSNEEYGRNCRVVITHRTNRFGEDVEVRRHICD